MKIMITGQARSGKDHAAGILCEKLDIDFQSSSYILCESVIYPKLKQKYKYSCAEECFHDRMNCRSEWYDIITQYNIPDRTALASKIFEKGYVYVGIRNREELEAAKDKWDDVFVIWIDASERVEPESEASCTVTIDQADIVIQNNGKLSEFNKKLDKLCTLLKPHFKERLSLEGLNYPDLTMHSFKVTTPFEIFGSD